MDPAMETLDDVMPVVLTAIGAYGASVLAKTVELAADTPAARGGRILQRVFGRGDARSLHVIEAAAGAGDESGARALRLAIAEAFRADPHLPREVAAMLPRVAVTAPADRPVTVGDNGA